MFKIGDTVFLKTPCKYTDSDFNPHWGGKFGFIKGKIITTVHFYQVQWDNNRRNSYDKEDLAKFNKINHKLTGVFK